MALLDVSFVLDDPMFTNTFDLIRRPKVVNTLGRTEVNEQRMPGIVGVITNQDPASLMRREEGVVVPQSIFIASRTPMISAVEGYMADIIIWQGAQYEVQQSYNYSRYGAGFFEAVAALMTPTHPV